VRFHVQFEIQADSYEAATEEVSQWTVTPGTTLSMISALPEPHPALPLKLGEEEGHVGSALKAKMAGMPSSDEGIQPIRPLLEEEPGPEHGSGGGPPSV
jgi:hypothetical protein